MKNMRKRLRMANVFIKSDKPNKKFIVIEKETKQELKDFTDYNSARKFSGQQNSGGGFNGFTPAFVLISLKDKIST